MPNVRFAQYRNAGNYGPDGGTNFFYTNNMEICQYTVNGEKKKINQGIYI